MVTITTSVFTDASHKDANADYGYQVYPELQISSFSFGAIVGPNVDNNTLQFYYLAGRTLRILLVVPPASVDISDEYSQPVLTASIS